LRREKKKHTIRDVMKVGKKKGKQRKRRSKGKKREEIEYAKENTFCYL
jgi:hypothetical protein